MREEELSVIGEEVVQQPLQQEESVFIRGWLLRIGDFVVAELRLAVVICEEVMQQSLVADEKSAEFVDYFLLYLGD